MLGKHVIIIMIADVCLGGERMPTPSMEDYIEQIYILIEEKGYARVSDIAEALSVHPSSVTKMVQKLDKDEYLVYEKYRGLVLTPKGKKSVNDSCIVMSCLNNLCVSLASMKKTFIAMLRESNII